MSDETQAERRDANTFEAAWLRADAELVRLRQEVRRLESVRLALLSWDGLYDPAGVLDRVHDALDVTTPANRTIEDEVEVLEDWGWDVRWWATTGLGPNRRQTHLTASKIIPGEPENQS